MKRLISIVFMLLAATLLLASCDNHEHTFSEEWKSDADFHWHLCTVSDECSEKKDSAAHEFDVVVNEEGALINVCGICGYENEKVSTAPAHEHAFSDVYSHSENYHWHECTVDGCFEADSSDEHQYGNPEMTYEEQTLIIKQTCVDCGYVKTETRTVESAVDDAVEWDNIFESFKLTNFSMYVFFGDKENPTHTNHCVVTEQGVFYSIPDRYGMEFYVAKDEDGTFEGYIKDGDEQTFYIMPEEMCEEYFLKATRETVIQVTFAEHFDKFEYNQETGTYFAEEAIEATYYSFSGEPAGTLYCYNSEVKVADGKIISIACDYNFNQESTEKNAFIYFNIGMSEVKIPQSVIDGAQEIVTPAE